MTIIEAAAKKVSWNAQMALAQLENWYAQCGNEQDRKAIDTVRDALYSLESENRILRGDVGTKPFPTHD